MLNDVSGHNTFHDRDMHGGIRLTSDPVEACKILGLDYVQWLEGFDTENDLFKWLSNCVLLKKSHYMTIDNNKARQQMIDWIAFIQDKEDMPSYDAYEHIKNNYGIRDRLLEILEREKIKTDIKSKFSASLIMDKGVTGSKIGKCIKYLHDIHGNKDKFETWIHEHDIETVHNLYNMHIDAFIANSDV